jgi:fructose-1,6-bisphosphatase I
MDPESMDPESMDPESRDAGSLGAVLRAEARATLETPLADALIRSMLEMSKAAIALSTLIALPPDNGKRGAPTGADNAAGDGQRRLELVAEALFSDAARHAPVAFYLSEEVETAQRFDPEGQLALAIDPLDGSSNIDVNAPIGTIFSVFPAPADPEIEPQRAFLRAGREQIAAGFFIYGPQTSLIVTVGAGAHLFWLDRDTGAFALVERSLSIAQSVAEYAINASNDRHWHAPVKRYVDELVLGADGPRGRNFNMRWIASLVADSYRIFMRGGIFLYPSDRRPGYEHGRLRLLYEANPIALLARQAAGAASDGVQPILDLVADTPHQRTPFVMGSADEVERLRGYHLDPARRS